LKVLLLGAGGQLGRALQRLAPADVDLATPSREELDICIASRVHSTLDRLKPELVINAAAYTEVDRAESEREQSFLVNAVAPGIVAEWSAAHGARMLQISTDFVFSGDRPVPWECDAETSPVNVYGQSKLAGERAVTRAMGADATVIRTSWLYGCNGRNFVTKIARVDGRSRDQIDDRLRPGRLTDLGEFAGRGALGLRAPPADQWHPALVRRRRRQLVRSRDSDSGRGPDSRPAPATNRD